MGHPPTSPHSCTSNVSQSHHEPDPRVEATFAAVDWDAIMSRACALQQATSGCWGTQLNGGFNLVRFLDIEGEKRTSLVVRVPLRPVDGWTASASVALSQRMSSEMATVKYIEAHTKIPVPHVYTYNNQLDGGGVGTPYVIMSREEGVPLQKLWFDMDDHRRGIILRQCAEICLELLSHRFDKIGALFHHEDRGLTKDAWYIGPYIRPHGSKHAGATNAVFRSGADLSTTRINAILDAVGEEFFGTNTNEWEYMMLWFVRSLTPTIIDPSLDVEGFPISPYDFHPSNIIITESDSSPRITGIIDWEFSCTSPTSTFCCYPCFITDDSQGVTPEWAVKRNAEDRATFHAAMEELEGKYFPENGMRFSQSIASSRKVQAYEEILWNRDMEYMDELFWIVFGDLRKENGLADTVDELDSVDGGDEDRDMASDTDESVHSVGPVKLDFNEHFLDAISAGILKPKITQLRADYEVWKEASRTLGSGIIIDSPVASKEEFITIVRAHLDRFDESGLVKKWLATIDHTARKPVV